MLTYENIKKLCKQKGVTVTGTEKELGFSRGSLCKIETSKPSMEKVQKLASYFNVNIEYLMAGGERTKDAQSKLTIKDERDIKKDLENLREKLANKEFGPAAFDGDDIPDDDTDLFLGQVELMLRRLKVKNKEKYNPHKNTK